MNGLILLANGFEDTEALTPRDILLRAGINVITASINDEQIVKSSFGINVIADTLLKDVDVDKFDFLLLPGGGGGTKNLSNSSLVKQTILKFVNANKLVAAICAAPSILSSMGLLKDKKYTCYAGFDIYEGIYVGSEVEVSKNFITARSMLYSVPFALSIVERLCGVEIKDKVLIALKGQNKK